MDNIISPLAEVGAAVVEFFGTATITLVALYGFFYSGIHLIKKDRSERIFQVVRQRLGQGILLGLEFLLAADIIHTVAVDLSFKTLGLLSIVLLIRTILSFTLEVELTGRWPWQGNRGKSE